MPAFAQTAEKLRQELEAQKAINEELRQRLEDLERRTSGAQPAPVLRVPERRLDVIEPETTEETTAIREALVQKGLVLLPVGSFRLAPGFDWTHSGADTTRTRSDLYTLNLTLHAGLPWGMMLTANAPYSHRNTSIGSNSGAGDASIGLSKGLSTESDLLPSFVIGVNYRAKNGKDPFGAIPIGFGFPVVSASVSAVKRHAPAVLYAGLAYSHPLEERVNEDNLFGQPHFGGRIAPGNAWSYRLGASLVTTPDLTLDASISGSFVDGTEVRPDSGSPFSSARATTAFLNFGGSFLLGRHFSLLLSGSAGATKDSPDYMFSIALPYRF